MNQKMLELLLQERAIIAIGPYYDGENSSMIYTHHGHFCCKETVEQLLEWCCLLYAASFEGRLNASRERLGIRKNPPILVSESLGIVAFQVPSPDNLGTIWIFDLDYEIKSQDSSHCELIFQDDLTFLIALSEKAVGWRKGKALELHRVISAIYESAFLLLFMQKWGKMIKSPPQNPNTSKEN